MHYASSVASAIYIDAKELFRSENRDLLMKAPRNRVSSGWSHYMFLPYRLCATILNL